MRKLDGIPVSPGIGVGRIYKYVPFEPSVCESTFDASESQSQLAEYAKAKELARGELYALYDALFKENPKKASIFKAHIEILDDEVMDDEIISCINLTHTMPDYTIFQVYNTYADMLAQVDDPLTQERATDIKDVRNRLIRNLYGMEEKNLSSLSEPSIVAAVDLFPSDTATLDRKNVVGIATEQGGATSHTAIIAKGYGIPAVLGIQNLVYNVCDNDFAILDAINGEIIINPNQKTIADYEAHRENFRKEMAISQKYADAEAVTKDGTVIEIGMNIGASKLPDLSKSADFVGLFRTEFLYMESKHMPTEDEQYDAYKSVLGAMGSRPVTLRTLDIGGDKKLDYMPLPTEENPFMGNRALRLCFDKADMFNTQLRAALRASVHGNLWIMFPMVGSLEDFRRAKACLEDAKLQLDSEKIPYSNDIKVGMMVEIPSVAMFADKFAKEVDFASIGTNDLCQYLFAVDRMNSNVSVYYQEMSPIMFRTLAKIVEEFDKADKPISICGELGGNHLATAVLIGLGLKKLSMNTSSFGQVRRVITEINYESARNLASEILAMETENEVRVAATDFLKEMLRSEES